MSLNDEKISRDEKRALIARIVSECKEISERYIKEWKPIDPSWITVEGGAYLRLSTDQQVMVEKGSLEQQVNIAASEADIKSRENKINYRIVRFFIEPGVTGKSDKRPEFNSMREGISRGLYRFIIVKELSRICRDDKIWHSFMDNCVQKDCEFIIRGLRLNPRDPVQRHMLNQMAGMAALESALISKRQKESNHMRLTVSKRMNGTHPVLGLDQLIQNGVPVSGGYVKNSKEAKVATWIFATMVATESEAVTLAEIKRKGISNKTRPFTKSSLHHFLTNMKLIAKIERNKNFKNHDPRFLMPYEQYKMVDLEYEPVISQDLWDRVQKIIERNAKRLQKNTKLKKVYLLHGLMQLPDGSTFHGTGANGNGGRKSYYYNKMHKLRLDADEAERGAADAVVQVIKDSEKLLKAIKAHSQSQTRQELLQVEIQRFGDMIVGLKRQRERASLKFETLLTEGSKDKRGQYAKEYENAVEQIDAEVTKFQARIDTLERSRDSQVDDFFDEFKDQLKAAQKIQDLISKKADQVLIKGTYRKLFRAVQVEPCPDTGTYKLRFLIGSGTEARLTNGGQGSVTEELVGPPGLEPGIRRL